MEQVASCHKPIAPIVSRACHHQNAAMGAGRIFCCYRARDAEARKLHELIHAEAQWSHELFVYCNGLILAAVTNMDDQTQRSWA